MIEKDFIDAIDAMTKATINRCVDFGYTEQQTKKIILNCPVINRLKQGFAEWNVMQPVVMVMKKEDFDKISADEYEMKEWADSFIAKHNTTDWANDL